MSDHRTKSLSHQHPSAARAAIDLPSEPAKNHIWLLSFFSYYRSHSLCSNYATVELLFLVFFHFLLHTTEQVSAVVQPREGERCYARSVM